jgi:Ca-activated chloride channel family protein
MEVRELGEQQATIRQILVITDGCSNVGADPVEAAERARRQGIAINVIGVVDRGEMGRQGREEALSIADAGGGMCRIVEPRDLSATAQMLTHQTMQMTLQQVVNQELLQALGKTVEDLPPAERVKVAAVMEKMEEEATLQLVVAVDTSASMRDKMPTVREAILDLALSLQARQGSAQVAVIVFPGSATEMARTVQPFADRVDTDDLDGLLIARGGTPTGPAIDYAVQLFAELRERPNIEAPDEPWSDERAASE